MISVRLLFNLASRTEGENQKRNCIARIAEEAKDEYKKEKEEWEMGEKETVISVLRFKRFKD